MEGATGLATENGLELLLAALKEAFKETESSEMAENFENFFFRTRRESGEDMISYQQKFMAAYRKKYSVRFGRASLAIAKRLRKLPPKLLGPNGERFLTTSLQRTALIYASILIMGPGACVDPELFDGGAS